MPAETALWADPRLSYFRAAAIWSKDMPCFLRMIACFCFSAEFRRRGLDRLSPRPRPRCRAMSSPLMRRNAIE